MELTGGEKSVSGKENGQMINIKGTKRGEQAAIRKGEEKMVKRG